MFLEVSRKPHNFSCSLSNQERQSIKPIKLESSSSQTCETEIMKLLVSLVATTLGQSSIGK